MTSLLTAPLSPAASALQAMADFFVGGSPTRPKSEDVFKAGNVACITGSSSGIGRALARKCASVGMTVFMADCDEAELALAHAEVSSLATRSPDDVVALPTDVSDRDAVERLQKEVFAKGGKCNLLVNNAGVGGGGGALAPLDDWQRTMNVNAWGPIHGCQAFVPAMKASGEVGLVVNTGSKQGITMPPGNLAYNTSKAALKCYTEGLEHELRSDRGCRVRAALLVPGWVNTSIALKEKRAAWLRAHPDSDPSGFDPDAHVSFSEAKPAAGAWMPDQVVAYLLSELDAGRFYVVCPDNDVDRATDKKRMTWAMQDITEDRPPLSRWHPDFKEAFAAFLAQDDGGGGEKTKTQGQGEGRGAGAEKQEAES